MGAGVTPALRLVVSPQWGLYKASIKKRVSFGFCSFCFLPNSQASLQFVINQKEPACADSFLAFA